MLSKNKNNKISRHQTNLRKKLQKLQRQSNQTYHATFAFTILALIILTALVAYISFQIGYTMGGFKAGAYEHSNSLQSFDQHSNVEETPSQKTGDYDDLGAPALKKGTLKDKIKNWADQYDVDERIALRIAKCETNFRNVCNSNGCEYGQGVFQFIPTSWNYFTEKMGVDYDVMNPDHNIEVAMWVLKNEGVKHWKQSVACHQFK